MVRWLKTRLRYETKIQKDMWQFNLRETTAFQVNGTTELKVDLL